MGSNMANEQRKGPPLVSSDRIQKPEGTPPAENSAAWVEKYVAWASRVLLQQRTAK